MCRTGALAARSESSTFANISRLVSILLSINPTGNEVVPLEQSGIDDVAHRSGFADRSCDGAGVTKIHAGVLIPAALRQVRSPA